MAAPCARRQLVRGPVRKCGRGRPFNGIVRRHLDHVIANADRAELCVVDEVAVSAFREFQHHYSDWAAFSRNRSPMTSLSDSATIIVAKVHNEIAGAVAYVGPTQPKGQIFDTEWAVMRMLVVAPNFRRRGIGHALAVESLRRAVADGAAIMGLHTSKIMSVALPMYERLGFRFERDVAPIYGVPYAIYVKQLTANDA